MKNVWIGLGFAVAVHSLSSPLSAEEIAMDLTPRWEYVADTVMGGVSTGQLEEAVEIDGRAAARLTGTVSLENNGGFVQMAFDLAPDGQTLDAAHFKGIEIEIFGNDEAYDLRLRTDALTRPWHSYRAEVTATRAWQTLRVPFSAFAPHRTDIPFNPARLRRFGVLAIGRVFEADVAISAVRLY